MATLRRSASFIHVRSRCSSGAATSVRGFTLIELLVAISVMALIAILSWRGIDGMVRTQEATRQRADEMLVLQGYLPQRMAAEETQAAVQAIVAELGAELGRAAGPGDMGKVMGVVKTRLAGKADMGQVSAAVKAALAG